MSLAQLDQPREVEVSSAVFAEKNVAERKLLARNCLRVEQEEEEEIYGGKDPGARAAGREKSEETGDIYSLCMAFVYFRGRSHLIRSSELDADTTETAEGAGSRPGTKRRRSTPK